MNSIFNLTIPRGENIFYVIAISQQKQRKYSLALGWGYTVALCHPTFCIMAHFLKCKHIHIVTVYAVKILPNFWSHMYCCGHIICIKITCWCLCLTRKNLFSIINLNFYIITILLISLCLITDFKPNLSCLAPFNWLQVYFQGCIDFD